MPKNLIPTSVSAPAFYGLNSQRKADILPFQWATKAENCVIDDSGRIASRKGYKRANATVISASPDVKSVFEYIDSLGSTLTICAAGNKIYKLVGTTLTDITGTITTPTADNWKFANFNGKCVGFQDNHSPIVLSTIGGTFTNISVASGSAASNDVLAAFGRLWILDGSSLKYSALLDETHWSTGAGSFDLSTVWMNGMDEPVALSEFNGHLIVFGRQSIAIWNNPWVPTGTGATDVANNMSLVENIGGVGCIARDSVQHIGTDILFLSSQGVRSLGRTIQEKSMPVNDISKNVNDDLNRLAAVEITDDIKSAYVKNDGFYIVTLPTAGVTYYFDLRSPLQDGSFKATQWDLSFDSLYVSSSDDLYAGNAGYLNRYEGYLDAVSSDGTGGTAYEMTYESGWNDLGQQVAPMNKLPKKISTLMLGGAGQSIAIKWAFDYEDTFNSFSKTIPSDDVAEWNIAEYNIGEYSGGLVYNRIKAPMSKSGQVIKFGINITINGAAVAIQQIDMYSKIGRMAA